MPVRAQSEDREDYQWTTEAAADCMAVALKDPDDPRRAALADPTGRLLALAAPVNPGALTQVITAVIAPDALRAWGTTALLHLIRALPSIA